MERVPLIGDESARMAGVEGLCILDTPREAPFNRIVDLVCSILEVPIAAVSIIDADRQWFKACAGLNVTETPRHIAFCSHAIEQAEPLIIPDARADLRFRDNVLVTSDPNIRSYAGVQLRTAEGHQVGTLCAIDQKPRQFSTSDISMLSKLAKMVEQEMELRLVASRDALTGALTRGAFCERASYEIARYQRYGRPGCLVLADVDYFKNVNDTYGHGAGDRVLQAGIRLAQKHLRRTDYVGRLGGEEFVVILPETTPHEALRFVERFRKILARNPVEIDAERRIFVTASFGIAPLNMSIATVEDWLSVADNQLYKAKNSGRNQCKIAV